MRISLFVSLRVYKDNGHHHCSGTVSASTDKSPRMTQIASIDVFRLPLLNVHHGHVPSYHMLSCLLTLVRARYLLLINVKTRGFHSSARNSATAVPGLSTKCSLLCGMLKIQYMGAGFLRGLIKFIWHLCQKHPVTNRPTLSCPRRNADGPGIVTDILSGLSPNSLNCHNVG